MNIYQSCRECPLPVFITCITTDDLTGLGDGTADQLREAWMAIYSEYCSLIGGVQIKGLLRRSKEAYLLSSKLDRLAILVSAADINPHVCFNEALTGEGYSLIADPDDREGYQRQLRSIVSRLKPLRLKLEMLIREMPAEDANGKKAEADDFELTLKACGKFEGFRILAREITVLDYCQYVQRLRDDIDMKMKQLRKDGNRR